MFCTIIIPTVGRDTLHRAVNSALNQKFDCDDFEVIVVNDSGRSLTEAPWHHNNRLQLIHTMKHERCVARNTGAAVARGEYLYFLDDDDWLLPDAIEQLWELSQHSDAQWLYGSSRLVDRQGNHLIDLNHEMNGNVFLQALSGEWIPLQASIIKADAFFAVGGFKPLLIAAQDVDLLRLIALHWDVEGISDVIACISWGREGSTTDFDRRPQLSRWAREQILDQDHVYQRLQDGVTSPYWQGRLVRIYLTSIIWNIQHRRLFSAISRGSLALRGILHAGPLAFMSRAFWHSILTPYQSETFARGQQIKEQETFSLPN